MHQRLPSLVAAVPSASLGDCWNYWNWTLPLERVLELLFEISNKMFAMKSALTWIL